MASVTGRLVITGGRFGGRLRHGKKIALLGTTAAAIVDAKHDRVDAKSACVGSQFS